MLPKELTASEVKILGKLLNEQIVLEKDKK